MEAAAVEMEVDVEGEAELEQELGGQDVEESKAWGVS